MSLLVGRDQIGNLKLTCRNQSLKASELVVTPSELVATLDDSDDVIWANIDAQVAEHRLRPGDIDVVATGQSRLEQRREIVSEFCFPEKRSAMRVTAAKRVDSQRTRDRFARWEFCNRSHPGDKFWRCVT